MNILVEILLCGKYKKMIELSGIALLNILHYGFLYLILGLKIGVSLIGFGSVF